MSSSRSFRLLVLPFLVAISGAFAAVDPAAPGTPAFPLVAGGRAAVVVVPASAPEVVRIAASDFASDVGRVTGVRPEIVATAPADQRPRLVIAAEPPPALANHWEAFQLSASPATGGSPATLTIAGSDRRALAYGLYELSRRIGVSPWYWWADVPVAHHDEIHLTFGTEPVEQPSVKYRGIFLNDEDWGLQPWAAKTFDPATGNIGPKTYLKIFELLLRLKANTLWPAMHPCSTAFNAFPENKINADRYAIVMGSSHCEPLLRNNVGEWDAKTRGEWNYQTNRTGVLNYLEERVKENGRYENSYTVGMRGVHDGAMPFKGTDRERVALLQKIITDERDLLAKYVNPKVNQIPQIFIPYKEVLATYRDGLKVPDDVTLVWPDDNFGYIRRLSNPEERTRSGGAGIYYHLSYWGAPEDYLWLCTTPPALVWEEMHKAYEQGARSLWIVNVGDIKPGEIGAEFFLSLAWNVNAWDENAQPAFLADWAARTFGPEHAVEIAAVLDEYYRLNYPAKPEHLVQAKFTDNYGEIDTRLKRFAALVARTDALYAKIPSAQRDAFFELVAYPVRGSALMNEKWLDPDPAKARAAYDRIQTETRFYNEQIAGGKWNRMMSADSRKRPVYQAPGPRPEKQSSTPAFPQAPDSGYVSFDADHPVRAIAGDGVAWKKIPGLGRSGDAVTLLPTTAPVPKTAALCYEFTAAKAGPAKVLVYAIPAHSLHDGMALRYAVSIDRETPQVVDLDKPEFSAPWKENVLRAAAIGTTTHTLSAGRHTLTISPLDPGVVFDKIVIDLGGLLPTQLGPPATHLP